jgi:hypothetical protein
MGLAFGALLSVKCAGVDSAYNPILPLLIMKNMEEKTKK